MDGMVYDGLGGLVVPPSVDDVYVVDVVVACVPEV